MQGMLCTGVKAREPAAGGRKALRARAGRPTLYLCLHCNLALEAIDKRAIAHRVPENVLSVHQTFSYCRGCDRVYWPGSHYERMRAALKPLLA